MFTRLRAHQCGPRTTQPFAMLCVIAVVGVLAVAPAALADSFTSGMRWNDFFCIDDETCRVGDFDGDGWADIAAFVRSTQAGDEAGDVYVALSDGDEFRPTNTTWQDFFCVGGEVCDTGDFNGDGKDDIIAFERTAEPGTPPGQEGNVYVALSNGSAFGASGDLWQQLFCIDQETCGVGDFNGDGLDDIVAFVQNTNQRGQRGDVYVALSDGTSFGPSGQQWQESFCLGERVCQVGDFNGDGRDDVIAFVRDSESGDARGDVYVALSNGSSFGTGVRWQSFFCIGDEICGVGDFNGDGLDDIITFVGNTQTDDEQGDVYVALSNGSSFGDSALYQGAFCVGGEVCDTGDANGDGRADAITFVQSRLSGPAEGDVYVALSVEDAFLPRRAFVPLIQR